MKLGEVAANAKGHFDEDAVKHSKLSKIVSKIQDNPELVREAEKMGKNARVQEEANHLINELLKGNKNPGIGTKNLFRDIYYLRGRNGARVFYRQVDGVTEILGKASKANEQKVIDILTKMYK